MKEVIVIGNGFWGSAIARHLRKAAIDYVVLDNGDLSSGTLNSDAYTCLRWFGSGTVTKHLPQGWTKERIESWVNWLIRKKYLEQTGQWVYNVRLDTWKRYEDCYLMRDVSTFSNRTKAHPKNITKIEDVGDCCKVYTDTGFIRCHKIVLATGVWTDDILKASGYAPIGVTSLNGSALLVEPLQKRISKMVNWNGEVITINVRPFKNYDLLPNSKNWWYYGATTEKPVSEKAQEEMMRSLELVFGGNVKVKKTLTGRRPMYVGGVVKVSDNIVVATGGGRIGLALAGPAADDVLSILKEDL